MSHAVIIVGDGTGPGGTAHTETRWAPSHDMSPAEEARRRERAQKLIEKVNDVLYSPASTPVPEDD